MVQFPLIKEPFFRFKNTGVQHPRHRPLVRYTLKIPTPPADMPRLKKRACTPNRGESGNSRWQTDPQRLFNFPLSQRTIQLKGRIIPIELHIELIVNRTPMQCLYIVFTHKRHHLSSFLRLFQTNSLGGGAGQSPAPPAPPSPLRLVIMAISGRNIAITMLPTMTARKIIMMGSKSEVMEATALSTSSS